MTTRQTEEISHASRMTAGDISADRLPGPRNWRVWALLFLIAPWPALFQFIDGGFTFFQQTLTPESVLFACGHGWTHPYEIITPLFDFLSGETRGFHCADLGALTNAGEAGLFSRLQPYFTQSAGLLWSAFGLNYLSLLPLLWLLYGAYVTGASSFKVLTISCNLPILWRFLGGLRDHVWRHPAEVR